MYSMAHCVCLFTVYIRNTTYPALELVYGTACSSPFRDLAILKEKAPGYVCQARRQGGGAGGCTCTPFFQPNNCMSFHRSS